MALGNKKNYHQGNYKVKNKSKYIGDPEKCTYRSGWERILCIKFDRSPNIIRWGCEPFPVEYISPLDNKMHRYWPDFIIEYIDKSGERSVLLIEVKPLKESKKPAKQGKTKARQLQESQTYMVNKAKWAAASRLCKKQGWTFTVMTENEIFGKNKKGSLNAKAK